MLVKNCFPAAENCILCTWNWSLQVKMWRRKSSGQVRTLSGYDRYAFSHWIWLLSDVLICSRNWNKIRSLEKESRRVNHRKWWSWCRASKKDPMSNIPSRAKLSTIFSPSFLQVDRDNISCLVSSLLSWLLVLCSETSVRCKRAWQGINIVLKVSNTVHV